MFDFGNLFLIEIFRRRSLTFNALMRSSSASRCFRSISSFRKRILSRRSSRLSLLPSIVYFDYKLEFEGELINLRGFRGVYLVGVLIEEPQISILLQFNSDKRVKGAKKKTLSN